MIRFTSENPKRSPDSARPLVILLQGPVGPFFRELQGKLVTTGFDVLKVNFNGGDLLFSRRANAVNFQGSPGEWKSWLDDFIEDHAPAAIVLFGDGRPYHKETMEVANDRSVATWCLEEGYIRPDFVTCERGGNNARSPLLQSPMGRSDRNIEPSVAIENSFGAMASYATLYAIAQTIFARSFRGNVRHRPRSIVSESARRALSLIRKAAFYPRNRIVLRRMLDETLQNYFLVALQVHDDLNLQRNGNGWTMERLIDETVASFANNAPPDRKLLFKVHPLDRGHRPYRRLIARAARAHLCESRILVVDDGPVGPMIRNCDGMVTVNSTSGLLALRHGKPLLALGNAVYSKASLNTLPSAMAELHAFWREPKAACRIAVHAFLARMQRESLINGSFYLRSHRAAICDAIAERIVADLAAADLARLRNLILEHCRQDETEHARLAM